MDISSIIKQYCMENGISQRAFAKKSGVSSAYITMLLKKNNPSTGKPIRPTIETYQQLADAMDMSLHHLFEIMDDAPVTLSKDKNTNVSFLDQSELFHHKIPLVGSVAGGQPIFDEEIDLYIDGPAKASCAVRLRGHSMEPLYKDGDIIYIREQPDVHEGQIAVVIMDDEASLKRVYHISNGLQLCSENPEYAPIIVTAKDYANVRILGVPCGYTRMYT